MLRHLFTTLSAASLLLCAGTCALYVRSGDGPGDRVAVRHARTGDRLTVRSHDGRLTLLAPPAEPPGPARTRAPDGQTAESIVAELSEADVRWGYEAGNRWATVDGREVPTPAVWADGPRLTAHADRLLTGHVSSPWPNETVYFKAELVPPLLRALDDPARFVAAHVVLAKLLDHDGTGWPATVGPKGELSWTARPDGSYVQVFAGMRAELTPDVTVDPAVESTPGGELEHHRCDGRVSRGQLPAVRDYWHAHLDRPAGSVSHLTVMAATGVLPLAWVAARGAARGARRRRRRAGRCPACGYDLRATPRAGGALLGRCPECGAVPPTPPTPPTPTPPAGTKEIAA